MADLSETAAGAPDRGGPGSRGPHAVRREATRRKVFEAAIQCLYEGGYAAASTLEVARRAGISRGALLKQFPTRAHMLAALLEHIVRATQASSEDFLRAVPPGIPRLLARADYAWEFYKTPPAFAMMEIALGARDDSQLRERLASVGLERESLEEQRVWEEMRGAGATDRRAVGVAVLRMVATVRGLTIERLMNRDSDSVEAAFAQEKQQLETLLRSLVATPG